MTRSTRRKERTMSDLDEINEHRMALDREPFEELTDEQIQHHLRLIDQNAPYGQDPWEGEEEEIES